MVYFLNAGTVVASVVTGPSPAGVGGFQSDPVVGNFNGDQKPDIAINAATATDMTPTTLGVGVNANTSGFYGGCNYPTSGEGIHVCSPTGQVAAGTISFAATANSFGQLRKMELWVDGVKVGEDHWIWGQSGRLNMNDSNLSAGSHKATIYAADIDNRLQRYDFTFAVN
jgi:hypothetical protein